MSDDKIDLSTICADCGHRRALHEPWHAPVNAPTLIGRVCTWCPPHSSSRCDCKGFIEPSESR